MLIYAVDDEYLGLTALEDAIREAAPEETLECFDRPRLLLEAARKTPPDVAFLDVEMPAINGVELAKMLKEIKRDVNIIFVTGYSDYMADAMNMFASGYVLKPVETKNVAEQLGNLRFPISSGKHISIHTFGNFTVMKDDVPVPFRYTKSKELLAYLVDRKGAIVSRRELDAVLFEEGNYSRKEQKMISRYVEELEKDLEAANISEIFVRDSGSYRVDKTKFSCDLYEYLEGTTDTLYCGEYMEEYSWGENFKANLEFL